MKDLEISKELFKEDFNSKCHEVFIKDEFVIAHSNLGMKMVNVCEFVFIKCKEWALTKGYKIQSQINYENKGHSHISKISENEWAKGFFKDTEIECILKACEWILEYKEN